MNNYDNWLMTEPEENEVIVAYDWKGEAIYNDDPTKYFDTDYGYIAKDKYETFDFVQNTFGQPIDVQDFKEWV